MSRTLDVTRSASELRIVLGQLIRRLRAEHTFPLSQGVVLARLDRELPRTTSALASASACASSRWRTRLRSCSPAGLVARRPDPLDKRQILIELTDDGRRMLHDDRRRRDGWLANAMAVELTDEEQQTLIHAVPLLRRLTQL